MTSLADVDGFKISIQVCMWLGFPTPGDKIRLYIYRLSTVNSKSFVSKVLPRIKFVWINRAQPVPSNQIVRHWTLLSFAKQHYW